MSESSTGETTSQYPFAPLVYTRPSEADALERSATFLALLQSRRSIRAFSSDPVPFALIQGAVAAAATAPSGANQQPWTFVVVRDHDLKRRIRAAAEAEERENYDHRFPPEWRAALAPLGTDWHKEFLEHAPYLIVVFKQEYGVAPGPELAPGQAIPPERRIKHYYATESVGIAVGFLIASLHAAGLAVLTHTPNPMGFLRDLLGRPLNEKPLILLPVGYPADDCRVPVLQKKPLDDILIVM